MVYGSGLENQRVFTGTVGSNPTLSVFSNYKGDLKVRYFSNSSNNVVWPTVMHHRSDSTTSIH